MEGPAFNICDRDGSFHLSPSDLPAYLNATLSLSPSREKTNELCKKNIVGTKKEEKEKKEKKSEGEEEEGGARKREGELCLIFLWACEFSSGVGSQKVFSFTSLLLLLLLLVPSCSAS